jgi:site-specific recombinase XerD
MDPTFHTLVPSFRRYLLATNRSARTVQTYLCALQGLTRYLEAEGLPLEVRAIRRSHLEAFVADRLATVKAATISVQYRALQQFFRWAVTEEEVPSSPMAKMRPPIVPEEPPAVLSPEQLRALIRACQGSGFLARRDLAIVRLLLDTGMRRAELAGLKVEDVDLQDRTAVVLGKWRRPRVVPFGHRTTQALDRYLRVRSLHRLGYRPELWLGEGGNMSDSGLVSGGQDAREASGSARGLLLSNAPHLRARVAQQRRQRRGPNEAGGLAQSGDVGAVRSLCSRSAGKGSTPKAQPWRQVLDAPDRTVAEPFDQLNSQVQRCFSLFLGNVE